MRACCLEAFRCPAKWQITIFCLTNFIVRQKNIYTHTPTHSHSQSVFVLYNSMYTKVFLFLFELLSTIVIFLCFPSVSGCRTIFDTYAVFCLWLAERHESQATQQPRKSSNSPQFMTHRTWYRNYWYILVKTILDNNKIDNIIHLAGDWAADSILYIFVDFHVYVCTAKPPQ